MTRSVAIAYIPVLHKGYMEFVRQLVSAGVSDLYLIGDDILELHDELDYINRKDRLRALALPEARAALSELTDLSVVELTPDVVTELQSIKVSIITPREDIGEVVVREYFKDHTVDYKDVFVRRNKLNVGETKKPDVDKVSMSEFQTKVWNDIFTEAGKSTDWWRQVGAALVQDGEVIYVTHNEHMPEEQTSNIEGDARSLFKKGININFVTSAHAEVVAIGRAAKEGIATQGAELYTTDFPCPYCARLIVSAGIAKVYFVQGYAVLDGDDFFRDAGIEVVRVDI